MAADASSKCELSAETSLIGPGQVVLIVGPSGAGKDAILREVRGRLSGDARFVFPRRVVTRQPDAAEGHDAVTLADFQSRLRRGAFALYWQAHGLHYAIPAQIDDAVRGGSSVVFNTSRRVTPSARVRYANAAVVLIDAPLHVRAERLAARDRERADEIADRLERFVPDFSTADADLVIENAGSLRAAVDLLAGWLRRHR